MQADERYEVDRWTTATAESNFRNQSATEITVNDRAATRQAIIGRTRVNITDFVERSGWGAHKNRPESMVNDWNYHSVAIHHAGRSAGCGPASLQLQAIQDQQMTRLKADDIGYHYAIDCMGNIFEGRDIRFKGEHLHRFNTGVIGIVLLENLSSADEGSDAVTKARSFMKFIGLESHIEVPGAQKTSTERFIFVLTEFFKISSLGGHKEFPHQTEEGKICPGKVGLAFVKQLRSTLKLPAP